MAPLVTMNSAITQTYHDTSNQHLPDVRLFSDESLSDDFSAESICSTSLGYDNPGTAIGYAVYPGGDTIMGNV